MLRKKSLYLLEKRILTLLNEEEKEIVYMSPEKYIQWLQDLDGNGDLLTNSRLFKNKEIYVTGDLNLGGIEVYSLGPLKNVDGMLNLRNSKVENVGNVKADKIVGADYILLKNYLKTGDEGFLYNLMKGSSIIDDYTPLPNRLDTEILLNMEDEKFLKMCGLDEDNSWHVMAMTNPYNNYYYYDDYSAKEDAKEGYIYNYFDDDNTKNLIDILNIIAPELDIRTDKDLDDKSHEIYEKLNKFFERDFDSIIDDFAHEKNAGISRAVSKEIDEIFTNIFAEYGLKEIRLFNEYKITVGDLVKLYEKAEHNNTIYQLFKEIGEDFSLPYMHELQYQVNEDFDSDSFNRSVYYNLNRMEGKIEDLETDNLNEYTKILDDLKKRFQFNKKYVLPKDSKKPQNEQRYFILKTVDLQTNLIKVEVIYPDSKKETKDLSLEDFNLLLHQPELFESRKK